MDDFKRFHREGLYQRSMEPQPRPAKFCANSFRSICEIIKGNLLTYAKFYAINRSMIYCREIERAQVVIG